MTALHSVKCSPLADLLERRLAMAYVFVLNSTEVGIVEIDRGVPDADLRDIMHLYGWPTLRQLRRFS